MKKETKDIIFMAVITVLVTTGFILMIFIYSAYTIVNKEQCMENKAKEICRNEGAIFISLDLKNSSFVCDSLSLARKGEKNSSHNLFFFEEEIEHCKQMQIAHDDLRIFRFTEWEMWKDKRTR